VSNKIGPSKKNIKAIIFCILFYINYNANMTKIKNNLENLAINTIRMLSVDMVEKANSGHPGLPMGAACMAYTLWSTFLRHNPSNPNWLNRDRFVLSAGHGSAMLYSLLHLTGYKVSMDDLKNFRQWRSITPGHPEYHLTPGVETTTGPLGQGFATGVGMALAQQILANKYNKKYFKIFDYNVYAIVSDGDLMEGVTAEAASYAGNLELGKLIYLYDSNNISIEGNTNITFTDDTKKRFESYNWHVTKVKDGNNASEIEAAIKESKKDTRPSLIIVKTHIGFGSPKKQDDSSSHGSPLGADEVKATRENLGWPQKDFYIPKQILNHFRNAINNGKKLEDSWNKLFKEYQKQYPKLAEELLEAQNNKLPKKWNANMPDFKSTQTIATRSASGVVLNSIVDDLPNLIGGSADLGPSNMTYLKDKSDIVHGNTDAQAKNLHFGIREHAMSAILNGLALSKIIIPYGATFLIFSDYMRAGIRMSALMNLRSIYVLTHDSIAVGEDGSTHEPIEQLMSLRAIPNLTVIRPADARETALAWKITIENKNNPTALILSRQKLPVLNEVKKIDVNKGGYIINTEIKKPDIILIATGSEVSLAIEASVELNKKNIRARVVSLPCWELFEKQSQSYKDYVLPRDIKARISIEAGISLGWEKYVGSEGTIIGIDHFGASAPGSILMEKFGFSVNNIVKKTLRILNK